MFLHRIKEYTKPIKGGLKKFLKYLCAIALPALILPILIHKIISKMDNRNEEQRQLNNLQNDYIYATDLYNKLLYNSALIQYEKMLTNSYLEHNQELYFKTKVQNELCLINISTSSNNNRKEIQAAIDYFLSLESLIPTNANDTLFAYYYEKIGNEFLVLAQLSDEKNNLNTSITYFRRAKKLQAYDTLSFEYGSLCTSIGTYYSMVYELNDEGKYTDTATYYFRKGWGILRDIHSKVCPAFYFNAGNVFRNHFEFYHDKKSIESAISIFKNALKIFKFEDYPNEYAQILNNFNTAYIALAEIDSPIFNLHNAIDYSTNALAIHQKYNDSINILWDLFNTAVAYYNLSSHMDKRNNINIGINLCNQSLQNRRDNLFWKILNSSFLQNLFRNLPDPFLLLINKHLRADRANQ